MINHSQVISKSKIHNKHLSYETNKNLVNENLRIHLKRNTYTPSKSTQKQKQKNYIQEDLTILKFTNNKFQRYKSVDITKIQLKNTLSQSRIKHKIINADTQNYNKNDKNIKKSDFSYHHMLGKGGFGKVWKVQSKQTRQFYAMKQMNKSIIITKNSIPSILNQRYLLSKLKHTFLINMIQVFQDTNNLYILMDLMQGGDLRYHLSTGIKFTELEAKFTISTILLCLKYLHTNGIVHRDIKPQNIVFDKRGYAYLTDLGIAKHLVQCKNKQTSGTPGYMAPEVLFHKHHSYQVDFFGLGVLLYEIMLGTRPYKGRNRQQIRQAVKRNQVIITKKQIPQNWSIQAADFVNKLLQRKPINRLGWNGIKQVISHTWLSNIPWKKLQDRSIQPPKKRLYEYQRVQYKKSQPNQDYLKLLRQNQRRIQQGQLQSQFYNYSNFNQVKKSNVELFCNLID